MKSVKGCALTAYLIICEQPQPREIVADLFWDSTSRTQSLRRLRVLLTRVRKWVPEVKANAQNLFFQPDADTAVDLFTLKNALAANNIARLDSATRLYHGDLLAGFYLSDAPRFNEWLQIEQERLRNRVLTGLRYLCEHYYDQQQWHEGFEAARRWVKLDDLDEAAYRWFMRLLAADGQIDAAIQQYQTCRQRLWDELAVEPASITNELAEEIKALKKPQQDRYSISIEPPSPSTLSQPGPLPPHSFLPFHRNKNFVGRKSDLLNIASKLLPATNRKDGLPQTVVIHGLGGLGKTQLAVEFAYRYGRYFPGGVYWLSFADADNVAEEVAAVGDQKGLGLYRQAESLSLADRVGRVRQAWQEPVLRLLIFDNCEDEALLSEWRPVTGGCQVLVTSRRGYWSPELDIEQRPLPVLTLTESVALLQKMLPDMNATVAGEIANEVGHLPLALHLAGSFLNRYRQISPDRYLEHLKEAKGLQHPSLQGRGAALSPTDHELDVARTFTLNLTEFDPHDEIDQVAQRLLAHAICFAPGEPIPRSLLLATVGAGDADMMALLIAEDGLMRLITLGFLESKGAEIVVIHRLLAAFLADVLPERGLVAAQTAVAQAILRPLAPYLGRGGTMGVLPFSAGHLRFVTDAALERGDRLTFRLALVFSQYLTVVAEYNEAHSYLEKIVQQFSANATVYEQGLARLLLSQTFKYKGLTELALDNIQEAERLLRQVEPGNPQRLPETLVKKGWLLLHKGQVEQAIAAAEESRALAVKVEDPEALIMALNLLGVLHYYMLDRYDDGRAYLEEALAVSDKYDLPQIKGPLLLNLGEIAKLQGAAERAINWYQLALREAQENQHRIREYLARSALHGALVETGAYDQAVAGLRALIKQVDPDWRILPECYRYLTRAYLGLGNTALALEAAQLALEHAYRTEEPRELAQAWGILGRVASQTKQPISIYKEGELILFDASTCFAESLKMFTELNLRRNQALVFWYWSQHELAQGDREEGKTMWHKARVIFEELRLPLYVAKMKKDLV
ncbi:MAG: tetratricopeptide repeat protein [Anaerolineales bacterium]|nr:tetratricopeptide repeat protein [Anaerolineales bacterium]